METELDDEPKITFFVESEALPKYEPPNKGECKYPFHVLDTIGKGFDVHNRTVVAVRNALRRWRKENGAGMEFTVRGIDGFVRVRRDK